MLINFYYLKVNAIINFVRDYFTLDKCANVGVIFSEEEQKLHIVCNYGMAGSDYSMMVDDLLEEEDIHTMFKMLINQLKNLE